MTESPKKPSIWHVMSTREDGTQVIETRRTSEAVARNDQSIIKTILFRNAWVVEITP